MKFKIVLTVLMSCTLLFSSLFLPTGQAKAELVDWDVFYKHKAWQVSILKYDDGSIECRAAVGSQNKSFSIWGDGIGNVRIQFYDSSWQFNNENANVVVQIDRRPRWDLTNVLLDDSSVWMDLDSGRPSERFIGEVMRGNVLKLFTSSESLIERYSLAGSSASIRKLSECITWLESQDGDDNPFN